MKVYYDKDKMNILIEGYGRYFANNSLIAENLNGKVLIRYVNTDINEFYLDYTDFQKENGTQAGNNVTEVVDYLNKEFGRGMKARNANFNGFNDTVTVLDEDVTSVDVIVFSPVSVSINERLILNDTFNGGFTVKRVKIDVLQPFTENLAFNYIKN